MFEYLSFSRVGLASFQHCTLFRDFCTWLTINSACYQFWWLMFAHETNLAKTKAPHGLAFSSFWTVRLNVQNMSLFPSDILLSIALILCFFMLFPWCITIIYEHSVYVTVCACVHMRTAHFQCHGPEVIMLHSELDNSWCTWPEYFELGL